LSLGEAALLGVKVLALGLKGDLLRCRKEWEGVNPLKRSSSDE
jgi:hypothetical protein